MPRSCCNWFTGGGQKMYVFEDAIILLYITVFLFCNTCADHTGQPIWKSSGSNDGVWCKKMPFQDGIATKPRWGVQIKKLIEPMGMSNQMKTVNNLWTVTDKQKVLKQHLCTYKRRTQESGCKPLAAEIDIPLGRPTSEVIAVFNSLSPSLYRYSTGIVRLQVCLIVQ